MKINKRQIKVSGINLHANDFTHTHTENEICVQKYCFHMLLPHSGIVCDKVGQIPKTKCLQTVTSFSNFEF